MDINEVTKEIESISDNYNGFRGAIFEKLFKRCISDRRKVMLLCEKYMKEHHGIEIGSIVCGSDLKHGTSCVTGFFYNHYFRGYRPVDIFIKISKLTSKKDDYCVSKGTAEEITPDKIEAVLRVDQSMREKALRRLGTHPRRTLGLDLS